MKGVKSLVTANKIRAILEREPNIKAEEIAKEVGVSTQSVYQHIRNHKLPYIKKTGWVSAGRTEWKGQFGHGKKLTSHFIGGTAEMYACADLLRRGIPVYRAITFLSAADLVVEMGGDLYRVEVKSGRRNQSGVLHFGAPTVGKFDILAIVDPDGVVEYRPPID